MLSPDRSDEILRMKACPHCGGSGGYFSKVRTRGTWRDYTTWEGKKENTEMMDSFVDTWESRYYYCTDCQKRLCRVFCD